MSFDRPASTLTLKLGSGSSHALVYTPKKDAGSVERFTIEGSGDFRLVDDNPEATKNVYMMRKDSDQCRLSLHYAYRPSSSQVESWQKQIDGLKELGAARIQAYKLASTVDYWYRKNITNPTETRSVLEANIAVLNQMVQENSPGAGDALRLSESLQGIVDGGKSLTEILHGAQNVVGPEALKEIKDRASALLAVIKPWDSALTAQLADLAQQLDKSLADPYLTLPTQTKN